MCHPVLAPPETDRRCDSDTVAVSGDDFVDVRLGRDDVLPGFAAVLRSPHAPDMHADEPDFRARDSDRPQVRHRSSRVLPRIPAVDCVEGIELADNAVGRHGEEMSSFHSDLKGVISKTTL
jgi:hypothetical protein